MLTEQKNKGKSITLILTGLFILTSLFSITAGAEKEQMGVTAEVKQLMGRPALFIDGRAVTEALYTVATIDPNVDIEYYCKQMSKADFRIFGLSANCGGDRYNTTKPVWLGSEEWDYSQLDAKAKNILAADPNGYLFLWVYIQAPEWWKEKNPDELQVLDDGTKAYTKSMYTQVVPYGSTYESLVSEKWRKDMAGALRKLIEHIEASDWGGRVFGYNIGGQGTFEWYHPGVNNEQMGDYSVHMRKAFGKWLKEKYGTTGNLQKAWSKADVTFENVQVPTKAERVIQDKTFRDPKIQMNVIDWNQFFSDIVADTIDYFGGVVKDATKGAKVVATYYAYLFEFRGNPEFGHNAEKKILESKNIDMLLAPPSYNQRELGGVEGYRRPFLSGTLHNKLWDHDNDISSYLFPQLMEKLLKKKNIAFADQDFSTQLFPTKTAQESIWHLNRSNGFVLVEGAFHGFIDMHGGYYDHPRLLEAMKQSQAMLARARNYDRSSAAEVLVVADEFSMAYGTCQMDDPNNPYSNRINHGLVAFQDGFIRSGAPFDTVLMEDLPLVNLRQYKFIVFLNTYQVDNDMRKFIDEKIKSGSRTIMWCYAPGLFNGSSESAENMYKLTGIKIVPSDDESFINPKYVLNEAGRGFMKSYGEQPSETAINMDIKAATTLRKIGEKELSNKNPEGRICKLISVKDSNAESLGVLPGKDEVVFARKKMDGWTSIYSIIPVMPADLVRTIEKSAGVHIYSNSNDAFYANKSYIVMHSAKAGNKTIHFPYRSDVYNALTEEKWFKNVTDFDLSLMYGETQILRYCPSEPNDSKGWHN